MRRYPPVVKRTNFLRFQLLYGLLVALASLPGKGLLVAKRPGLCPQHLKEVRRAREEEKFDLRAEADRPRAVRELDRISSLRHAHSLADKEDGVMKEVVGVEPQAGPGMVVNYEQLPAPISRFHRQGTPKLS